MTDGSAAAQKQIVKRICPLLGPEISGTETGGFVASLRGLVEQFRIEYSIASQAPAPVEPTVGTGFVLELAGMHACPEQKSAHDCSHCSNLLLALRLVGDWLFPVDGDCRFCEVHMESVFVRAAEPCRQNHSLTRTLRFVSQAGTECRMGACHLWCTNEIKERLCVLNALERNEPPQSQAVSNSLATG